MNKIVECVPNFSEGRNDSIIKEITDVIEDTNDVMLLDVDPGAATNRTVVTFIGSPEAVKEAAFRAIKKASEVIEMSTQKGEHPRMGATDVCPFIPVSGVSMDDCVQIAREVAERVGEELKIPIYLYEEAATKPERKNLATIRQGEYEGLAEKLKDPEWQPDFGPNIFNPKSGATNIGAREFLIAYNINLNTRDKKLANEIALNLRERGRAKRDKDGKIVRGADGKAIKVPGRLKSVKGVGWYIEEYQTAQVSYNLTNCKITPVHITFEESCKEAEKLGLRVTGSELVGLIPLQAMLDAGKYFLARQGKSTGVPDQEIIQCAIKSLGLDDLSECDPDQKIIEYRFRAKHGKLASMGLHEFADLLSTETPSPGGGSVAALAGALASSLAAMVANLTFGNKKYKPEWEKMEKLAVSGQQIKKQLLAAIDDDTDAFNSIMAANRLPKKTEENREARTREIEAATQQATLIPLKVMELSLEAMKLCKPAARLGNINAVSDVGVGALMANSAVMGAFLNVKINLPGITDEKFKHKVLQKAQTIRTEADMLQKEILELAEARMTVTFS